MDTDSDGETLMGLFSFLSGKTPETLMANGDLLFTREQFGLAKIEYEKAKARHAKKPAQVRDFLKTIDLKLSESCEALSRQHLKKGMELLEAGCREDARERLTLALELTAMPDLSREIEAGLSQCHSPHGRGDGTLCEASSGWENGDSSVPALGVGADASDTEDELETFEVLTGTLSPEEKTAYREYGETFISGFVALNRGDFSTAVQALERSRGEQASSDNYIGLELGTALLNLEELDRAQEVLTDFLGRFPLSLRGYQALCEVLWMKKSFDRAHALLDSCPESIARWAPMVRLKGETWCREGELTLAARLYQESLEQNGMDASLLRALADVQERLGEPGRAYQLYAGLISSCNGCGQRPDVDLRRRFADAGVASGVMTSQIIDVYLKLVAEDPDNRAMYYEKVGMIYDHLGNGEEAERFKSFALKAQ